MVTDLEKLQQSLLSAADANKIKDFKRFFKTEKGQYGEGDEFIGLSMPQQHAIIKDFKHLDLSDLEKMLHSPIHEFRMSALLILVAQFKKANAAKKEAIYQFYLKNIPRINNWDLVDCSCRDIVGAYLFSGDTSYLYDLAQSGHLWSERIAIVSTWYFIREKQFSDTFRLSEILLSHKHDLIHKAVGWMLREAWKRDELAVEEFLEEHVLQMNRTTLRYAIERMSEPKRRYFMTLK